MLSPGSLQDVLEPAAHTVAFARMEHVQPDRAVLPGISLCRRKAKKASVVTNTASRVSGDRRHHRFPSAMVRT